MMTKLLLASAFVISVISLPWWASFLVAAVYLGEGGSPFLVILGALASDMAFGALLHPFGGFSYLFTLSAVILSGAALYLRHALFE